jgi:inner membrane protein
LLGAAIGQAFFARSLGSRAVAWGAVLNMLPDVDVAMIPLAGGLAEWRYHRGVTHGLWFGPVVGAVLGWALWRWRGRSKGPEPAGPARWMALAIVSLLAHPLADAFTSYGTLLLWPSPRRFAWDALPIIDLLFSAVLLLAVLVGRLARRGSSRSREMNSRSLSSWGGTPAPPGPPPAARSFAVGALAFCVAWEGYGLYLNDRAEDEAGRQLAAAGVRADVHAYPVLLQPWLRRLVARDAQTDGIGVGWLSTWRPAPIAWHFFRSATGREVEAARRLEDVRMFEWFAMGQTAARVRPREPGARVELDDLRYGFPTDPEHGLWGVEVAIGPDGEPLGEVQRIRRPPPSAGVLMRWLWSATFK